MIDKIYIDFYGGTHGHFLKFLINRFILRLPEYKDLDPFTAAGTAHAQPDLSDPKLLIGHYSEKDFHLPAIYKDLVIQILFNIDTDRYALVYNSHYRSGQNQSQILNDLLKSRFESTTKKEIRNEIYSQILFAGKGQFVTHTALKFFVQFSDFADKDTLKQKLISLAELLNLKITFEGFDNIYNKFYELSGGLKSQSNVENIFQLLIDDEKKNINFNIFEEAYLNTLITKHFDIYSDISVFDEEYPQTTIDISKEIKLIQNKRNPLFNINMPIAQQWDQVALFP